MNIVERDGPLPVFREDAAWEDVQAELAIRGLGDGLPLVPPTNRRLGAMLANVATPGECYAMLPPMFGDLTPAAAAYCCVLAGCVPAELPAVLTAAAACAEEGFNLLGLLTTTGTPAVATMVHGPIARELGMNSGTNCLGPGNRANASIGRAMSLVMRIVAGAVEQTGDMATMGQPGKYAFCFAEGDNGLLPTLAERRGLPPNASAVTVFGVSGTMEVLPLEDRDNPETILGPIALAMSAAGAAASAGKTREPGEQVVLMPPEVLEKLRQLGCGVADIQQFLFTAELAAVPDIVSLQRHQPVAAAAASIIPIEAGGPGIKMTYMPLWAGGSLSQTKPIIDLSH